MFKYFGTSATPRGRPSNIKFNTKFLKQYQLYPNIVLFPLPPSQRLSVTHWTVRPKFLSASEHRSYSFNLTQTECCLLAA